MPFRQDENLKHSWKQWSVNIVFFLQLFDLRERSSRQSEQFGNQPQRADVFKYNRYDNSYGNIFGPGNFFDIFFLEKSFILFFCNFLGRGDQDEDADEDVYRHDFLRNHRNWYLVTEIVLTYCEKNCSRDREKLMKV